MSRSARVGVEIRIPDNELDGPEDQRIVDESVARGRAIGRFRARMPERLRALYLNQGQEDEEREPLPELPGELMNVEEVVENEEPPGNGAGPGGAAPESGEEADGQGGPDPEALAALGPNPEPDGDGLERENVVEEEPEELGVGQGDAKYHTYTGRGPIAKHRSEMYEERKFHQREVEKDFQLRTIARLQEDYQLKIEEKDRELRAIRDRLDSIRQEHSEEYEMAMDSYNRISESGRAIEEKAEEEKLSLERAAYLKWELKSLSKEYKKSGKQMAKLFSKGSSIREKDSEIRARREAARETLRQLLERQRSGETLFFAQRRIQKQRNVIRECCEKLEQNGESWEMARDRMEGQFRELENLAGRHEETDRQRRDLKQRADVLKEETQRQSQEREDLLNAEGDLMEADWLKESVNLLKKRETLEKERETLESRKEGAENEVLAADLLLVPSKDGIESGWGIFANGKMYLDEPEDEFQLPVEYDDTETKLLTEEQKIVTALKQREIFQYVNSDNLMEYLTYDENQGEFQLPDRVDPELPKEELRERILEIQDRLTQMGVQTNIGQLMRRILSNGEVDLARISAEILQEAMRIEATGENLSEDDPEKMGALSPLVADSKKLVWGSLGAGFVNVSKFLGSTALNAGFEYAGIDRLSQAGRSKKTGDYSMTGYRGYMIYSGMVDLLKGLSLGMDMLFKLAGPGVLPTFLHESVWGNVKFLSMEILGNSSMSVLGAISGGLNIGSGLAEGIAAGVDKGEKRRYAARKEALGQKVYGRILEDSAVEKGIQQFNGLMKAAMGGASVAFALTGIGGLLATGITFVTGFVTKLIVGAVRRAARKKEILNSPEILGDIKYNDKLIDEDHFNLLLSSVTGLNDRDSLYQAIKVTDSINVHRAMKRSILHPDPDVDMAMEGLGYSDKTKYKNIKLKDIQKKIGYNGDWKKDLHKGIETRGIDYDTNFTRFVKGKKGLDYYEKKLGPRVSRQEMMAKRREAIRTREAQRAAQAMPAAQVALAAGR